MNKICTDIQQSKKLIELGIDINTADMHYMYRHWEIDENTIRSKSDAHIGCNLNLYYGADNGKIYHYIPAWSLTALLKLIVEFKGPITWDGQKVKSFEMDNILDAAFEMICWLLEDNY